MESLAIEAREDRVMTVRVEEDRLALDLEDGRTIYAPLAWHPRLAYATQRERLHFKIIGEGRYIHWPDLDEVLSVSSIMAGRRSAESTDALKKWLASRPRV